MTKPGRAAVHHGPFPGRSALALLRRFWPELRPERGRAAAAAALQLLTLPATVLTPFLVRQLFDGAVPGRDVHRLTALAAALVALALLAAGVGYARRLLSVRIGNRIRFRLTRRLMAHVVRLPWGFFDRQDTGYLMSRLRDDPTALAGLAPDRWAVAAVQLLRALVVLGLLVALDPGLALAGLLLVVLLTGVILLLAPRLRRRSEAQRETDARSSSVLHEALRGLPTVRSAAAEAREGRRFGRTLAAAVRAAGHRDVLAAVTEGSVGLVGNLGVYLILVVGAYRIVAGQTSVGGLVAFFVLLSQLMNASQEVLSLAPELEAGLASLERIGLLLDEPREPSRGAACRLPRRLRGEVELRGVSLTYGDGTRALDRVSLHLRPGEVVALVGRSGAGKSTLGRLLLGLQDPSAGQVHLDGRPLADYPLAWLRRQIGVVPQEVFLFGRSVWENLTYATPGASRQAVVAAARAASAHGFIERLPAGYDTVLGEEGARLSGGERQRLAIAREILRDPAILILDEATSHLDPESEAAVRRALAHLLAERTCLVVAHRLSTLELAHRIVVLDRGRVVEEGRHAELLVRGGLYRRFHELARGDGAARTSIR